jgi:hypothetical protein
MWLVLASVNGSLDQDPLLPVQGEVSEVLRRHGPAWLILLPLLPTPLKVSVCRAVVG